MIKQKSWVDLLGYPQFNEEIDGSDIVREVDLHRFRILWSFESPQKAKECLDAWHDEIAKIYYKDGEKNNGSSI